MLKAWYGDAATKENDYCFDLLPRVTGDHSHFGYWLDMQDGNDPTHTSVGGLHAAFIVRGDPKQYNLPPNPEVPTTYLKTGWTSSAIAAGILLAGSFFAFLGTADERC